MDSRRYRGASRSSPCADTHGHRGTMSEGKERKQKRKTTQKTTKNLFVNQNLFRDQCVVINRSLFADVEPQEAI
jgi:hypothetical protein